jgi:hypothetical protein
MGKGKPPSTQEQTSFILDWYKAVDPTSVVSGNEIVTAGQNKDLFGMVTGYLQTLSKGSNLNEAQIIGMMSDIQRRGEISYDAMQEMKSSYLQNVMGHATPEQKRAVFYRDTGRPEWYGQNFGTPPGTIINPKTGLSIEETARQAMEAKKKKTWREHMGDQLEFN